MTAREEQVRSYFERLHEETKGWVMVGHGIDPYLDRTGKVKHRDFHEKSFAWPRQADQLVAHVVETSDRHDVYATPGLSDNPIRKMERRKPKPSRHLWVDLDGAAPGDLARLNQILTGGSFAVASGRGEGHLHGYPALDEPAPPEIVANLNRRLVALVHGDPSPSALNGYLRPPGTYNYKPTVLEPGSRPVLVTVKIDTVGAGWSASDLDDLLPPAEQRNTEAADAEPEPLPDGVPDDIAAILADPADANLDRSERLFELVVACRQAGLTDGQTLTAAGRHRPSAAKYGRRLADETRRALSKVRRTVPGDSHGDLFNARRLVAADGADMRHAPQIGRWFIWDGRHWAEDVTGDTDRRAKATVDSLAAWVAEADNKAVRRQRAEHWIRSSSASRIRAMTSLAGTEPGIPVTIDQLDADPYALAVRNGVIDLRTGELSPHARSRMTTRHVDVDYRPGQRSTLWERFLNDIFAGDDDLVGYIQRLIGYSATGSNAEHILPIPHGAGQNGKSTLLGVIQDVLGPWAMTATDGLLVVNRHEQHPERLAQLHRRRLVVSYELESRRTLAESLVKQLTGADRIRARFMRQDSFEFVPTHTLWLVTNHKPRIVGTDHAIWRRIRLLPFTVQIPDDQVDKHLGARLAGEHAEAILAWLVAGAAAWAADGLREPQAVIQATASYRDEEDLLATFLNDQCVIAEHATVRGGDLWEAWRDYITKEGAPGDRPGRKQDLFARLDQRFDSTVYQRGKTFLGVGLLAGSDTAATEGGS